MYTINCGTNGRKPNNFSYMEVYEDHHAEKVINDSVDRRDEEPVNTDFTISEIQNKLFS